MKCCPERFPSTHPYGRSAPPLQAVLSRWVIRAALVFPPKLTTFKWPSRTPSHLTLEEAFTRQSDAALPVKRTSDPVEAHARTLRLMHEQSIWLRDASMKDSVEDALQTFLEGACALAQARYGAISVFDAQGKVVIFQTHGITPEQAKRIAHLPKGIGLLGHIQTHRKTLRLEKMQRHPNAAGFPEGHPHMQSLLACPILHGEESVGNLYLSERLDGQPFDLVDELLIETAARGVALLVREKQTAQQLREKTQAYLEKEAGHLSRVLQDVSQGDFTAHAEGQDLGDTVSALRSALNATTQTLRAAFGEVRSMADTVGSGLNHILNAVEAVATGTHESSIQMEQVSRSLAEMNAAIAENAQVAHHSARRAEESDAAAQHGQRAAAEIVTAVDATREGIESTQERIRAVRASSKEIAAAIRMVERIAEQINLVSINAEIESARAGEHGRGFVVVAQEVRALSEQTQEATSRIQGAVKSVAETSERADQTMQNTVAYVQAAVQASARAQHVMEEIRSQSQSVLQNVATMAAATEQQSVTSESITHLLTAITEVSQEGAATLAGIATITQDLHRDMQHLLRLTERFKI